MQGTCHNCWQSVPAGEIINSLPAFVVALLTVVVYLTVLHEYQALLEAYCSLLNIKSYI